MQPTQDEVTNERVKLVGANLLCNISNEEEIKSVHSRVWGSVYLKIDPQTIYIFSGVKFLKNRPPKCNFIGYVFTCDTLNNKA